MYYVIELFSVPFFSVVAVFIAIVAILSGGITYVTTRLLRVFMTPTARVTAQRMDRIVALLTVLKT